MMDCTKSFTFEAAHRLFGYDGKCANLHGHQYVVDVTIRGEPGPDGIVLDFGEMGATVGRWIDDNWDHATILHDIDPAVQVLQQLEPSNVYPMARNPTAENMAELLLQDVCPSLLPADVQAVKVVVWETRTCRAESTN